MTTELAENVKALGELTKKSGNCGWMFDEVAWLLHALISFTRPEVVIQTGHLWGKSACVILDALQYKLEIEGNPRQGDAAFDAFVRLQIPERLAPGRLISVDPGGFADGGYGWLKEKYPGQFEHYDITSGEFFRVYGDSQKVFLQGREVFGLVDGDHTPEGCWKDLVALADLGARILFVDDTAWLKELEPICAAFAASNGYQFLQLPYMNGVGLLVKR
jgi:hypothetical protein